MVDKKRAFGELSHPETPSVNLDRVSHVIKELKKEDSNWYGKAKVIDTPMGNIVKSFIDEGAVLGVSSRGVGSLKENNGARVVQEDFHLAVAADIVADPSAPDAFISGLMENKEWVYINGLWLEEDAQAAKKIIEKASPRNLDEAKLRAFAKFLGGL